MATTALPPVTLFQSAVATIGGVPRAVWLIGEHDAVTDAELADTIARAIALDDEDLVLDLSMVEYMGASTVGVIVRSRELLAERSRSLTIRAPSRPARRVLDVCGIASLVDAGSADPSAGTGALSTWVDVPKTERSDPVAHDVPPAPATGTATTAAPTPAEAALARTPPGP